MLRFVSCCKHRNRRIAQIALVTVGLLLTTGFFQSADAQNAIGASASSGPDFGGFRYGANFGARGAWTNDLTNLGQFTFNSPDPRPNPTASLNSTSAYGGLFLQYGAELPQDFYIGARAFWGYGNNSRTIEGIPGTGFIAPNPAVRAMDSTKATETWNAGLTGMLGKEVQLGGNPFLFNMLGGVGLQQISLDLNCTAAGACGTNGIAPVTLSTAKTLPGFLVGAEIQTPLATFLPTLASYNAIVNFQYLHGDFGHLNATLGNPAQIQLDVSKRVTTDTLSVGFSLPLSAPPPQQPSVSTVERIPPAAPPAPPPVCMATDLTPRISTNTAIAPRYVCGPDVTDKIFQTFRAMKIIFDQATDEQRTAACINLYGIPNALYSWDLVGFSPSEAPSSETTLFGNPKEDVTTCYTGKGWLKYAGGGIWKPFKPWFTGYSKACAIPRPNEACAATVQFMGTCQHTQVVNYVMWGMMNRLCGYNLEGAQLVSTLRTGGSDPELAISQNDMAQIGYNAEKYRKIWQNGNGRAKPVFQPKQFAMCSPTCAFKLDSGAFGFHWRGLSGEGVSPLGR